VHCGLRFPNLRTAVERACSDHPQVVRCHPLHEIDGRPQPFPTLFWLTCPRLDGRLADLERRGAVKELQMRLEGDESLLAEVRRDHASYIDDRWTVLTERDRSAIRLHGLAGDLLSRGIGGILNFSSVKCLHLHAAHHLARGSTLGKLIEEMADLTPCGGGPSNPTD